MHTYTFQCSHSFIKIKMNISCFFIQTFHEYSHCGPAGITWHCSTGVNGARFPPGVNGGRAIEVNRYTPIYTCWKCVPCCYGKVSIKLRHFGPDSPLPFTSVSVHWGQETHSLCRYQWEEDRSLDIVHKANACWNGMHVAMAMSGQITWELMSLSLS